MQFEISMSNKKYKCLLIPNCTKNIILVNDNNNNNYNNNDDIEIIMFNDNNVFIIT